MSAPQPLRRTFRTGPGDEAQRLDRLVLRRLADIPGLSRVRIQEWIEAGRVRIGGVAVTRSSVRPALGTEVEVLFPHARPHPPPAAQEIPLSILFEDDWLLALDKPPGMVAHPTKGHADGTLVNALLFYLGKAKGGAGLVNRLDKGTSGVLLVAKAPDVHARLARVLATREAEKEYLAAVYGPVRFPKGRIDRRILRAPSDPGRRMTSRTEGKDAATLWERLAETGGDDGGIALLRCRLLTGRTHQIRVHLQAEGMPIVGDPLYGEPCWKGLRDPALAAACRDFPRQALHARRLRFPHPVTREPVDVVAPVPPDLAGLLAIAWHGHCFL
ncbi:MAG TPA: RluA family pseudouridine synthase [Thermoanaerobaculia bacterium]|nr:RluA family pseudouridine synthase [Thermoanaerobaculia bacterium]